MSASREKKQRQNDPDQVLTQKQRKEQEEQQAAKRKVMFYTVIGVIAAVLVVVLLVWHSGVFQRSATAVSVAGRDYHATDVAYYYASAMQEAYSTSYGTTFNPREDLRTQYVDAEQTQSYHDRFLQQAVDSLVTVAAMENAAQADGYTLTDDGRQQVDAAIEAMKASARQYGYDYSGFLKANYGQYMTPSAYKTCLERDMLINGYYELVQERNAVSEADEQDYYQANADTLDSYDFRVIYINGAAPSGTDADGNPVEPTEAESAAALRAAKLQADRFAQAVEEARNPEDTFVELAPDYVSDSDRENYETNPDYSLAEAMVGSNAAYYGGAYFSWLSESGRKSGDVTVVESGSGYYVVLFLDRYLEEGGTADVRHILIKAELAAEDDPATADVDESKVPTQAALDAAKAEAQALLDQWKSGEQTAESFGALATEHSDDSGSASNGGLYEAVYHGRMFPGFNDWILDPARQPGDTTLIENPQEGQQGWHVVYFQGWNTPLWQSTASDAVLSERMTQWLDGLTEGLEATQGSGVQYVG